MAPGRRGRSGGVHAPETVEQLRFAAMAAPSRDRARLVDRGVRAALWVAYRILLVGWFVFRPRRRGVFVAVWHRGRLLAIRNSYRNWVALPAGGIERGETPLEAALRELREEVDIDAAPDALRFVREIPARFEFKRDRCSFFELVLAAPIEPHADRREVIWAGFLTPDEALAARLAPPVREYLEARLRERPPWLGGRAQGSQTSDQVSVSTSLPEAR
jgi:8-oxo-dGTP diphosphatase